MKRVSSETRLPGMASARRCSECGLALAADSGERCEDCRPRLSAQAQAVGAQRRQENEEIERAERMIEGIDRMIRKMARQL